MENKKHDSIIKWPQDLKSVIIIITYVFVCILLIFRMQSVGNLLSKAIKLLTPFIIGFVIAYVLNRPYEFIKNKLLSGMKKSKNPRVRKAQKPIAIILVYLIVIGITAAFVGTIIPNLITSATSIVQTLSSSTEQVQAFMTNLVNDYNLTGTIWEDLQDIWKFTINALGDAVSVLVPSLVTAVSGFTKGIAHTFIGIVVSVYLLADKEHMKRICKKCVYALMPEPLALKIRSIFILADETFGNFIIGQVTVAAILGCLCFISMVLLRMPYAVLISVIVGFSNIIPYFGPFLGAIPGTFILFSVKPILGIVFVILVVILQQIDNNFISPKVVGGNLGLSGLWVLFAITVGGGIFGIPGMIIGAPCFAVIYKLTRSLINEKLKNKGIRIN